MQKKSPNSKFFQTKTSKKEQGKLDSTHYSNSGENISKGGTQN